MTDDPFDIESIFIPENQIAVGNDSHVFHHGDVVLKRYQATSLPVLSQYVALVNNCVGLIEKINYSFEIVFSSQTYRVSFCGIPVDDLFQSRSGSGSPVTVSRFVPEPNLDKLAAAPEIFSNYKPIDPSPAKQSFFVAFNTHLNTEYPTRLRDEFDFHICMLSRLLDFELNTFGLYIGKYNVKLVPDVSQRTIMLVVTDVAVYIPRVVCAADYQSAVTIFGEAHRSALPTGDTR